MVVDIDDVVKIIDDEFSKAVFSELHNKAIIHSIDIHPYSHGILVSTVMAYC